MNLNPMRHLSPQAVSLLAKVTEVKRTYGAIAARLSESANTSLAVTSSEYGEGKTTVAALLAVAAVTGGRQKVLAVDLNWFRPKLHAYLGSEPGLDLNRLLEPGGCAITSIKSRS